MIETTIGAPRSTVNVHARVARRDEIINDLKDALTESQLNNNWLRERVVELEDAVTWYARKNHDSRSVDEILEALAKENAS